MPKLYKTELEEIALLHREPALSKHVILVLNISVKYEVSSMSLQEVLFYLFDNNGTFRFYNRVIIFSFYVDLRFIRDKADIGNILFHSMNENEVRYDVQITAI